MRDSEHLQQGIDNDWNIALLMLLRLVEERKIEGLLYSETWEMLIVLLVIVDFSSVAPLLLLSRNTSIVNLSFNASEGFSLIGDCLQESAASAAWSPEDQKHLSVANYTGEVMNQVSLLTWRSKVRQARNESGENSVKIWTESLKSGDQH